MSEVVAQLARGGRNRAVGAHDMNEHSSRSHMIFNVRGEIDQQAFDGIDAYEKCGVYSERPTP